MADTKKNLIAEYDQLEDSIEEATPKERIWALADWLAEHIPSAQGERSDLGPRGPKLTLKDIIARERRSERQLRKLRQAAEDTKDNRLPDVSPRTYLEALRVCKGDLDKANERLKTKGKRLRDQSGPMESTKALIEQLRKRSSEDQAAVIDAIVSSGDPRLREGLYRADRQRVFEQNEGSFTEAERKAGQAHLEKNVLGPMRKALNKLVTTSVAMSLNDATNDLHEMVEEGAFTADMAMEIMDALQQFTTEFEVARAMISMSDEIEGMTR